MVNRTSFKRSTWDALGCPENVRNRVSEHNVLQRMLDIVSIRLCFIHQLWERLGMNDPHPNSHPQFPQSPICPHTSDLKSKSKQFKHAWCFWTKKKDDWAWGLLMENLKYWLLIGRANLILTNGFSFTVCSQPFGTNASGANWWPNLELIQAVPSGD